MSELTMSQIAQLRGVVPLKQLRSKLYNLEHASSTHSYENYKFDRFSDLPGKKLLLQRKLGSQVGIDKT